MPNIKQIVVSSETLLAKLSREFPNLTKVATAFGSAITGAGVGFTLGHVQASAKKHDPKGDDHEVHYHPETKR